MNESELEKLNWIEEVKKIGMDIAFELREMRLEMAYNMRGDKTPNKGKNEIRNGIKERDIIIHKTLVSATGSIWPSVYKVFKQSYDEVCLFPIICKVEYLNNESNHRKSGFVKYKIWMDEITKQEWWDKDVLYEYEIFNENQVYRR